MNRNLTMNRFVLSAAASLAALALVAAIPLQHRPDRLDGKWDVVFTPDHGHEFKDVVTFHEGKISDEYFAKKGFNPAMYDVDTRGIQVNTFTATQESEKEGKLTWTGQTSAANELTGELKWTHKNGQDETLTFKGEPAKTKR